MSKTWLSLEPARLLGSGPGNSRSSNNGVVGTARRSVGTLVIGTLHLIAVRRRAWRRKLRRLIGRPKPGAGQWQGTEVKLSDHALRDIGLTRMDLEAEPEVRSGGRELGDMSRTTPQIAPEVLHQGPSPYIAPEVTDGKAN